MMAREIFQKAGGLTVRGFAGPISFSLATSVLLLLSTQEMAAAQTPASARAFLEEVMTSGGVEVLGLRDRATGSGGWRSVTVFQYDSPIKGPPCTGSIVASNDTGSATFKINYGSVISVDHFANDPTYPALRLMGGITTDRPVVGMVWGTGSIEMEARVSKALNVLRNACSTASRHGF